jgi:hypothetical protein
MSAPISIDDVKAYLQAQILTVLPMPFTLPLAPGLRCNHWHQAIDPHPTHIRPPLHLKARSRDSSLYD